MKSSVIKSLAATILLRDSASRGRIGICKVPSNIDACSLSIPRSCLVREAVSGGFCCFLPMCSDYSPGAFSHLDACLSCLAKLGLFV